MGVGDGVTGLSLSTTKMSHAYSQTTRNGRAGGGPEGPGTSTPRQSQGCRVEIPFPVPPPHWGRPGRLHRCWHPNEKVNIEPKDLGVVGQLEVPRKEVPVWDQLGSPRVDQRERGTLNHRGRDRLGNRPGETVGSAHCIHRQGGAFRVCSVLRSRPLEPLLLQHLVQGLPGPWAHTVSLRPPGPHRAPPLILPSHFQRLKCLFFRQGRK